MLRWQRTLALIALLIPATILAFGCIPMTGNGAGTNGDMMNGTNGNDGTGDDGTGDDGNGEGTADISGTMDVTADQEVPPTQSDGSGSGTFSVDSEAMTLTYRVTAMDLTGDVTDMHFHLGAVGEAGGVVIDLGDDIVNTGDGAMMAEDTVAIDDEFLANLQDGLIYLNLHTEANPPGEIRGQLIVDES